MLSFCRIRLIKSLFFIAIGLFAGFGGQAAYAAGNKLTVSGGKVLTADGRVFIPEGISVYGGLEASDYDVNTPNDYAQIKAAAAYWHANTVRLQVAESNLFSRLKKGQEYNRKFLAAVSQEVSYAHGLGMAVVINDQTEFTSKTPQPTGMTAAFWKIMAAKFSTKPYVIFDIFNEPRLTSLSSANPRSSPKILHGLFSGLEARPHAVPGSRFSSAKVWSLWRDGGTVNGVKYLGMQKIVRVIRSGGASNLIWVEGSYGARRLPPPNFLLRGSNLVYSIHHPNLNSPASWNAIGSLAARQPVVEGEWAQYESNWAECYSRAYKNAPLYLNYLHQRNIGIIAWSLQAGSLLKGRSQVKPANLNAPINPVKASALKDPSRLLPNYTCDGLHHGQGVGRLLMDYFKQNSARYNF